MMQQQFARQGISQGLAALMEDGEPDVDWLGEVWSRGLDLKVADGVSIQVHIVDEGSKLGVNWMDQGMWAAATGASPDVVQRIIDGRASSQGFQSLVEAKRLVQGLSDADLDRWATLYSPLNAASSDETSLELLFIGAGFTPFRARQVALDIANYRDEHTLVDLEQLLHASSVLTRDDLEALRPWVTLQGPININTASAETLRILLESQGYDDNGVGRLMAQRATEPIRSVEQIAAVLGISQGGQGPEELLRFFSVESRLFRITSRIESGTASVEAIVRRLWDDRSRTWHIEVIAWSEGGE